AEPGGKRGEAGKTAVIIVAEFVQEGRGGVGKSCRPLHDVRLPGWWKIRTGLSSAWAGRAPDARNGMISSERSAESRTRSRCRTSSCPISDGASSKGSG